MNRIRVTSVDDWADACSAAFVPLKVRAAVSRFTATLEHVSLTSTVAVTLVTSTGSEVYRNHRVIAASPRDDLLMSFHRRGTGRVLQSDREARLRPGSVALYDTARPYTLRFSDRVSEVVLRVPRSAVNGPSSVLEDLTARRLPNSASLTALSHLVGALLPSEERTVREAEFLSEAAVVLVRAALVPARSPGPARLSSDALWTVLRAHIDGHLADPDLSVESLAASHFVSARLVHKIFADRGEAPGAYIRRQRLTYAYDRLLGGSSIAAAAMASGFSDPDSFRRAFKQRYQCRPSEIRPL